MAKQIRKGDPNDWWGPDVGPLPTPRSVLTAHWLRLHVRCEACHHERDADLQALVKSGRGDVPLRELRFRCSRCGSRFTDSAITSIRPDVKGD